MTPARDKAFTELGAPCRPLLAGSPDQQDRRIGRAAQRLVPDIDAVHYCLAFAHRTLLSTPANAGAPPGFAYPPFRTANSLCASATPFNWCSPRSSKATLAHVRSRPP